MSSGSTWNRWELHMHTPFTKKNDRFTISSDEKKEFKTLKSNKIALMNIMRLSINGKCI